MQVLHVPIQENVCVFLEMSLVIESFLRIVAALDVDLKLTDLAVPINPTSVTNLLVEDNCQ